MGKKRHTAEEIVAKLRQVDVLTGMGELGGCQSEANHEGQVEQQFERSRSPCAVVRRIHLRLAVTQSVILVCDNLSTPQPT